MVVLITNITDVPKEGEKKLRPMGVRIFNKELSPGKSLRVDASYVDSKMRKLEEGGYISIGKVPPWYQDHKDSRCSRRTISAKDVQAQYEAARVKESAKKAVRQKLGKPAPMPPMSFDLSDSVPETADEVTTGTKDKESSKKKRKRR